MSAIGINEPLHVANHREVDVLLRSSDKFQIGDSGCRVENVKQLVFLAISAKNAIFPLI
jgi:hypothetical protein